MTQHVYQRKDGKITKSKVIYNKECLATIEGKTVKELIENNFTAFKKTISENAGNAAGFILENVWLERESDSICKLHVIAHGNDNMINYDPTNDKSKEIVFDITGISKENLVDRYDFEIEERKEFNPFDEEHYSNISSVVGILEECVDFLAENSKSYTNKFNYTTPTTLISTKYPTLRKNNLSVYITQLMTYFSLYNVSRTSKNEIAFKLIEKANDALVDLMENNTELDATRSLMYYKTRSYLRKLYKITALKYYRERAGKTQQEVASEVGISLRQYQRYENINSSLGDTKYAIIEKIAETVGVNAGDIVSNGIVVLK